MSEKKEFLMKPKENLEKGRRGILRVIFGRTGFILVSVLIQIGMLLIGFQLLTERFFAAYYGLFVILGFALVVHIINKRGNPAFQIAWIVPILVFPVFGALFYLYFYMQADARMLNKRIQDEESQTRCLLDTGDEAWSHLKEESPQMANMALYLHNSGTSAVYQHTQATYFSSGEEAFEAVMEALLGARHYIFIEFFIVNPGEMWDTVLEVLKAKVKEGVEVRFMYDGTCELFRLPKNYPRQLEKEGIQCRVFAPIIPVLSTVQNNRDHRKILVVDGHTAFTGGLNLADEYINKKVRFGYWKDAAVMLRGEAVRNFTLMFLQLWAVTGTISERKADRKWRCEHSVSEAYVKYLHMEAPGIQADAGYVIPFEDNPLDSEQVGELVYLDIIHTAKEYVHIMTPYLVLDHEMMVALTYAAKRGVDVRIMMPHIPDKKYAFILARTYYNELLAAGVKIYEFIPGFVHSKVVVSDNEKAVIGSINMDFRSLYLSFECAVMLYRKGEVLKVEKDFQDTLKKCVKVTEEVYKKQNIWKKLFGKLLRLFAPLM